MNFALTAVFALAVIGLSLVGLAVGLFFGKKRISECACGFDVDKKRAACSQCGGSKPDPAGH